MLPSIPAAFHGVWWDTLAHCADELSDTYLRVEADRVTFYESSGTVRAVQMRAPGEVAVSAEMEGEGERWTTRLVLRLSEDGKTLTDITDPGKPFARVRCPAR